MIKEQRNKGEWMEEAIQKIRNSWFTLLQPSDFSFLFCINWKFGQKLTLLPITEIFVAAFQK